MGSNSLPRGDWGVDNNHHLLGSPQLGCWEGETCTDCDEDGIAGNIDCNDSESLNQDTCGPCSGDWVLQGGQGDIDLLGLQYCSSLTGDLSLSELCDGEATNWDLVGLSNLLWINGNFTFLYSNNLENLDDLARLTSVTEDFALEGLWTLSSIAGLSQLATVGGELSITSNPSLCSSAVDAFIAGGLSYGSLGSMIGNNDGC